MASTENMILSPAYLAEDYTWFPLRCGIASIVMVTIAYALRFWSRHLQVAPWSSYDSLMIPGYLCNIGMGVCGILSAEWGAGRHIEVLMMGPPSIYYQWGLTVFYISTFMYIAAITLPRLSILYLYLQLFSDRYSRCGVWIVVAMLLLRAAIEAVLLFFQCDHMEYAWQVNEWIGHCTFIELHYTYSRVPNIAVDVIMLILPMPTLWRLALDTDVKCGLIATFSLASFGLVTAVVGFVVFHQGAYDLDLSWVSGEMVAWSVLEPAVYFTSACMLTYKPLLRLCLRKCGIEARPSQTSTKLSRELSKLSWCSKPVVYSNPTSHNTSASVHTHFSKETLHKPLPPAPTVRMSGHQPPPTSRVLSPAAKECRECYGCIVEGTCDRPDSDRTSWL